MTAQAGSASSPSGLGSAAERSAARLGLRRQMRLLRAGLAPHDQQQAARSFARQAQRTGLLRPGLKVAAYVAVRNEADLAPLIARALRLKCQVYLPRVVNLKAGRMEFLRLASRPVNWISSSYPSRHSTRTGIASAPVVASTIATLHSLEAAGTGAGPD